MEKDYKLKIDKVKELIKEADYVLIGAGSGLSTSAGHHQDGHRFEDNFAEYIEKYGFKDMFSAGFYPFETLEEKWGYWTKYIYLNRFHGEPNQTYKNVLKLVDGKEYFVITTNLDHLFQDSGIDKKRLFYTQGDYGLIQCSIPCHTKAYDNREMIDEMVKHIKDCKIPSDMVPKCPKCGAPMEMNLRVDNRFVQDEGWYTHSMYYRDFVSNFDNDKKIVFLEIGVGYNTPGIIKYPFETMTYSFKNATLVRINKFYAIADPELQTKAVLFPDDADQVISDLLK